MPDRFDDLRRVATDARVDAIALVPGANFARSIGGHFHQNERPLVVLIPASGAARAIVPSLDLESFALVRFDGEVHGWQDADGYHSAFTALVSGLDIKRIGVEGQVMRVFIDQAIRRALPGVDVIDLQREVSALRMVKTPAEIDTMRRAIATTETALAETIDSVRIGMTEKQIESRLLQALYSHGADEMAFSPIVAAADNAARPHASARADYALKAGDPLLFDLGARVDGVCADITRTVFVGHCNDRHAKLYNTVLDANEAGIKASRAGNTAEQVDGAATSVLQASAFADYIVHKTGHGLGRDVHEDPYLMQGNTEKIVAGSVFTIEPGLYIPGDIGVRIEDDVQATDGDPIVLTTFDKTLQVLPG